MIKEQLQKKMQTLERFTSCVVVFSQLGAVLLYGKAEDEIPLLKPKIETIRTENGGC